jgi:hypothetical protein
MEDPRQRPNFEADLLKQRREALQLPPVERHTALALSGGGIRSATFSLGVLQAIAMTKHAVPTFPAPDPKPGGGFRASLLSAFDYLSTVSGGGYAGAFLCSLFQPHRLRDEAVDSASAADDAVAALAVEAPGRIRSAERYEGTGRLRAPLAWLRENGRYLVPTGVGDAVYAAALGLRSWISLHVVIGTVLLALFGLVALVRHGAGAGWPGLGALPLGWLREWEMRNLSRALDGTGMLEQIWPSALLLIALVPFLFWAVPCGIAYWVTYQRRDGRSGVVNRAAIGMLGAAGLVLLLAWLDASMTTGSFAPAPIWPPTALAGDSARRWTLCALAVLLALAVIYYVPFALARGYANEQRVMLTRALSSALIATGALAALGVVETFGQTLYLLAAGRGRDLAPVAGSAGLVGALVWIVKRAAAFFGRAKPSTLLTRIPLTTLAGIAGVLIFVLVAALWVTAMNALLWAGELPDPATYYSPSTAWLLTGLVGGTFALAVLAGQFPGFINLSSLQSFYSARLTRAYLGASNGERFAGDPRLLSVSEPLPGDNLALGAFYDDEGQRLTTGAPLHIINVTVNKTVDPAEQLVQRDRKGQPMAVLPFGFAIDDATTQPFRAGLLGSEIARPLSLGQWIGTSGAAFSTGIGRETSLGMSLLMGMANVRLGVWWQSGAGGRLYTGGWQLVTGAIGAVFRTQTYLSYELRARFFGLRRRWQYLSDGGHFENTAIYELLRPHRNVGLIVATDCGADPEYGFADLANLIRLARIDLGVEVEVDRQVKTVAPLGEVFGTPGDFARPPSGPWTPPYAVLLKAARSGSPRGSSQVTWIVLLKPSLHASAPADARQYGSESPLFPQEPTTDQFFNEAQWESYRALGLTCAARVFASDAWGALMGYIANGGKAKA